MHVLNLRTFLTGTIFIASLFALTACGEEEEGPGVSGAGKSSHNAGRNCIGCHGDLKYAGTVYTDQAGGTVAGGETIVVTQTDGAIINIVSDDSGNFYTKDGDPGVGYTVTVQGNSVGMISQTTNGACSASGCHDGSAVARVYKN